MEFDKVLLLGEGCSVNVGTPFVEGSKVVATVEEQGKSRKVNVIKFKRRQGYRRTRGHRQELTVLRVTDILADGKKKAAPKKAAAKKTPAKAEAPAEASAKAETKE